jgi:hypothetical protein
MSRHEATVPARNLKPAHKEKNLFTREHTDAFADVCPSVLAICVMVFLIVTRRFTF